MLSLGLALGVGLQPARGDDPSEQPRALDVLPRPWWVRFVALGVPYAVSTGTVPGQPWLSWWGQPGWALWGWWGPSEAASPSACFSPLEAADEQSIFLSLALSSGVLNLQG